MTATITHAAFAKSNQRLFTPSVTTPPYTTTVFQALRGALRSRAVRQFHQALGGDQPWNGLRSPGCGVWEPGSDSRAAEIIRRICGVSKPRRPRVVLRYITSSTVTAH